MHFMAPVHFMARLSSIRPCSIHVHSSMHFCTASMLPCAYVMCLRLTAMRSCARRPCTCALTSNALCMLLLSASLLAPRAVHPCICAAPPIHAHPCAMHPCIHMQLPCPHAHSRPAAVHPVPHAPMHAGDVSFIWLHVLHCRGALWGGGARWVQARLRPFPAACCLAFCCSVGSRRRLGRQ